MIKILPSDKKPKEKPKQDPNQDNFNPYLLFLILLLLLLSDAAITMLKNTSQKK